MRHPEYFVENSTIPYKTHASQTCAPNYKSCPNHGNMHNVHSYKNTRKIIAHITAHAQFLKIEKLPDPGKVPSNMSLLPFVNCFVGPDSKSNSSYTCLVDSGSTHTLMSFFAFTRLKDMHKLKTIPVKMSLATASSSDPLQDVLSKVSLTFTFRQDDKQTSITTWVFVVAGLSYPIIIGNNVLNSNYIHAFTPKKLWLHVKVPDKNAQPLTTKVSPHIPMCNITEKLATCNDNLVAIPIAQKTKEERPRNQFLYNVSLIPLKKQKFSKNQTKSIICRYIAPQKNALTENIFREAVITGTNENKSFSIPKQALSFSQANLIEVHVVNNVQAKNALNSGTKFAATLDVDETPSTIAAFNKSHPVISGNTIVKVGHSRKIRRPRHHKPRFQTPAPVNLDHQSRRQNTKNYKRDNVSNSPVSEQAIKEAKLFLLRDKTMSNDDRARCIKLFKEQRMFPLSCSFIADKQPKITQIPVMPEINEISHDECIDQLNLKHLDKKTAEYIKMAMRPIKKIFARHQYDIGTGVKWPVMKIELKEQPQGIVHGVQQPIPEKIKPVVQKHIDLMEKYGILEQGDPCPTFVNPISYTYKKADKLTLRLLCDMRLANSWAKKIHTPTLPQTDIHAFIKGKTYFSCIDLNAAFYSITLHPDSRNYTSIMDTNRVCKRFVKLPMGFSGSPSALLAAVTRALSGLHHNAISFADDILIATSGDKKDHIKMVVKVLTALKNYGFKISAKKALLCTESFTFLGFYYANGKVHIPTERANQLLNLKTPSTQRELKSYLMTHSFVRQLLPNFAHINAVFKDRLGKEFANKPLNLQSQHFKALNELRTAVKKYMPQNPPDFTKPFYALSDASDKAASFILWQMKDRKLSYVSSHGRVFTKTELNKSIYEKELLSIISGLQALRPYIQFSRVKLFCDAKSIIYLQSCLSSHPSYIRQALTLNSYDLEIVHIDTRTMAFCDYATRLANITNKMEQHTPIMPNEATKIVDALTLPRDYVISPERLKKILTSAGLPALNPKPKTHATLTKSVKNELPRTTEQKFDKTVSLPKIRRYCKQSNPAPRGTRLKKRITKTPTDRRKRDLDKAQALIDDMKRTKRSTLVTAQSNTYVLAPSIERSHTLRRNSKYPHTCTTAIVRNNTSMMDTNSLDFNEFIFKGKLFRSGIVSVPDFIKLQTEDSQIAKIRNSLPTRNYFLTSNVLMYGNEARAKPVLPVKLLKHLFHTLHYTILGSHASKTQMRTAITKDYHVLNLDKYLADWCRQCAVCSHQRKPNTPKQQLHSLPPPVKPRMSWYWDFACDLPVTKEGYKNISIFCDAFSLYIIAIPTKTRDQSELIKITESHLIGTQGTPKMLLTDRDKSVLGKEFQKMLNKYNIYGCQTASYSSWQSKAELTVKKVKNALQRMCHQMGTSWIDYFYYHIAQINSMPTSYGFTPEFLHFSNTLHRENNPLNIDDNATTIQDYVQNVEKQSNAAKQHFLNAREKHMQQCTDYCNQRRHDRNFQNGDIVLVANEAISKSKFLKINYNGPYIIENVLGNGNVYIVRHLHNPKDTRRVSASHLKHTYCTYDDIYLRSGWDNSLKNLPKKMQYKTKKQLLADKLMANDEQYLDEHVLTATTPAITLQRPLTRGVNPQLLIPPRPLQPPVALRNAMQPAAVQPPVAQPVALPQQTLQFHAPPVITLQQPRNAVMHDKIAQLRDAKNKDRPLQDLNQATATRPPAPLRLEQPPPLKNLPENVVAPHGLPLAQVDKVNPILERHPHTFSPVQDNILPELPLKLSAPTQTTPITDMISNEKKSGSTVPTLQLEDVKKRKDHLKMLHQRQNNVKDRSRSLSKSRIKSSSKDKRSADKVLHSREPRTRSEHRHFGNLTASNEAPLTLQMQPTVTIGFDAEKTKTQKPVRPKSPPSQDQVLLENLRTQNRRLSATLKNHVASQGLKKDNIHMRNFDNTGAIKRRPALNKEKATDSKKR